VARASRPWVVRLCLLSQDSLRRLHGRDARATSCGNLCRRRPSLSTQSATINAEKRGKPRWRRLLLILGLVALLLATWTGIDLFGRRTSHLREFDPDEVARLETAMWRSYYDKKQVRLFLQLAELLRKQYNMPFIRSNVVAYRAAKAAFVFKRGKQRSDYEQALPDLFKFYAAVRKVSATFRSTLTGFLVWNWSGGSFTGSELNTPREIWLDR
jgi:hypothetical protein